MSRGGSRAMNEGEVEEWRSEWIRLDTGQKVLVAVDESGLK